MEFRWIGIITLWTLIAGPIFDSPHHHSQSQPVKSATSRLERPAKPTQHNHHGTELAPR